VSTVGEATSAPGSAGPLRLNPDPRDLPREKLAHHGPGSLTDAELLALFFGTGTKGLNVIEMSRRLLETHGSLVDLSRFGFEEFMKVPGIGEAKAKHLAAAFELGKRLARQTYSQVVLETPEQIMDFLAPDLRSKPREVIHVVLLNTRLRHQRTEEVALGTINECLARPADLLRPAVVHHAYAFVLAHNHPSGDCTPSEADRTLTRRVREAAALLGIRFLDHLIVGMPARPGEPGFFSFRQAGLL
jgi:DNA repair protein RadC